MIGDRFGLNDKKLQIKSEAVENPERVSGEEREAHTQSKNKDNNFAKAVNYFGAFGLATAELTVRLANKTWAALDPVVIGLGHLGMRAAPKVARGISWTYRKMSQKKDALGNPHFDPGFFAKNIAKTAVAGTALSFALPIIGFGAYYYGTWGLMGSHKDVYIPNTGVFQSNQFLRPGEAGSITAPRDQIHSIMGKYIDADGKIQPQYFEIDSNRYFFFYPYAMQPDKIAAQLNSQSPYGLKCDLETTGFYMRLSRYFRIRAIQWLDFRPEIIKVDKCVELQSLPEEFKRPNEEGRLTVPKTPVSSYNLGYYNNKPDLKLAAG